MTLRGQARAPGDLSGFFHTVARTTYGDLGLRDDAVVGYVADILTRFVRTETLYRLRDPGGRRLESIAEMLIETARPVDRALAHPDREREMRRHVGDYALFMSGLFPEHVARRGGLAYYQDQGRRAYRAVFEHDRARYRAGAALFAALSDRFADHAGALHLMRQVHFGRRAGTADPIHDALRELFEW
jgi:hypothetical protein